MPRNAATNRFRIRNQNASIFINGTDGAAGNALSIANNASLSPTAAVTLELWFRPIALKAGILFDNSTVGTTNSYFLSMGADGSMNWFSTIGGLSKTIVGTAKKAKFFEWNCVSATYNGSAVLIFLNGSQLAETLAASGALGTNSGPLRIGAYYSGGISATFLGNLSQPRVYAAGCTLAEHQDRYYRSITSTALQAGLVLDLNTQLGAGSTVTDLSGLGNHATMGASASWTSDSPFKARKASVNANMVKNGDFEYAPPFTAATTTITRYIDGTAGGSTTNDLFGWGIEGTNSVGSVSARFDTSNVNTGTYSMKVSTTATASACDVRITRNITAANVLQYGIRVTPNTDYDVSFYMQTVANSGSATQGAHVRIGQFTSAGASVTSTDSTKVQTTTALTRYTFRFTTSSTTTFLVPGLRVVGSDGAGTLIMDAWFDDLTITPVYPEGRVPANGNLVKNFDFEVVPTLVAATSTAGRWIEGSAAGSTTNSTYKWATATAALTATVGASFDTTVSYRGSASLKLEALDATGVIVVANVLNAASGGSLGTIPIAPSTAYTFSAWVKTSTVGSNGAYMDVRQFNAGGGTITTTSSTKLSGTNDWTQVTGSFTSDANATNVCILFRNTIAGQASIMWVDDIYLAPTTNPGRIAIT